jgi:glucose/arabinose dehydrogenase
MTMPPTVDFTPAPPLSSFTFYSGQQFPNWHHDLLVGSLRARTLYRIRMEQNLVVELEKLVEQLGRIRDVETDSEGSVYLLVEHKNGGSLLRLVPSETDSVRSARGPNNRLKQPCSFRALATGID